MRGVLAGVVSRQTNPSSPSAQRASSEPANSPPSTRESRRPVHSAATTSTEMPTSHEKVHRARAKRASGSLSPSFYEEPSRSEPKAREEGRRSKKWYARTGSERTRSVRERRETSGARLSEFEPRGRRSCSPRFTRLSGLRLPGVQIPLSGFRDCWLTRRFAPHSQSVAETPGLGFEPRIPKGNTLSRRAPYRSAILAHGRVRRRSVKGFRFRAGGSGWRR